MPCVLILGFKRQSRAVLQYIGMLEFSVSREALTVADCVFLHRSLGLSL